MSGRSDIGQAHRRNVADRYGGLAVPWIVQIESGFSRELTPCQLGPFTAVVRAQLESSDPSWKLITTGLAQHTRHELKQRFGRMRIRIEYFLLSLRQLDN